MFKITATHDGVVRIKDTFNGVAIKWSVPDVMRTGNAYECKMIAGQAQEGRAEEKMAVIAMNSTQRAQDFRSELSEIVDDKVSAG